MTLLSADRRVQTFNLTSEITHFNPLVLPSVHCRSAL